MASGTEKNTQATESQVLTYTSGSQTITGTFKKIGRVVTCTIEATGNTSWNKAGWQPFLTGLRSEFQPENSVIASIGQAPNKVQGICVTGTTDTTEAHGSAGDVRINAVASGSTASLWVEGYFVYFV